MRPHAELFRFLKVFWRKFFNGYVTLLEVTENFWRLSGTAQRFEICQNFEVTSAESRNHA